MVILAHPTGNANVRAALDGFRKAGLLDAFYTSIASFPDDLADRFSRWLPALERRRFDPQLKPLTRRYPWREMGRLLSQKGKLNFLTGQGARYFSIDAVYRSLDRQVASALNLASGRGVQGVYAYDDGAFQSFVAARSLHIKCFYDLPTGYWRKAQELLECEKERWPEWANTIEGFHDGRRKLEQKDAEIGMADHLFVASRFTAGTLQSYPGELPSLSIVPYGFPPVAPEREWGCGSNDKRLRLLFVGNLSQQKGLADLIHVADQLRSHVTLTLIGRKPMRSCKVLDDALTRHQWLQTMPHRQVLEQMRMHDVLVFPTLFDGFGLVITEAMSQGLPVVASDRCAGPDLIRHQQNGWLFKAGTTESLLAAVEQVLAQRAEIPCIGRAAMHTAQQRPWSVYGSELAAAVAARI